MNIAAALCGVPVVLFVMVLVVNSVLDFTSQRPAQWWQAPLFVAVTFPVLVGGIALCFFLVGSSIYAVVFK